MLESCRRGVLVPSLARRLLGLGTRIPTESQLVDAFEVARTTDRRAIAVLREEGLIYTVPQQRSYVTRKSP